MADSVSMMSFSLESVKEIWSNSQLTQRIGIALTLLSIFLVVVNLISLCLEQFGEAAPSRSSSEESNIDSTSPKSSSSRNNSEESKKKK